MPELGSWREMRASTWRVHVWMRKRAVGSVGWRGFGWGEDEEEEEGERMERSIGMASVIQQLPLAQNALAKLCPFFPPFHPCPPSSSAARPCLPGVNSQPWYHSPVTGSARYRICNRNWYTASSIHEGWLRRMPILASGMADIMSVSSQRF